MSLEKWLTLKEKEAQAERVAAEKAAAERAKSAEPEKKPGFFSRLLEKAQKPL